MKKTINWLPFCRQFHGVQWKKSGPFWEAEFRSLGVHIAKHSVSDAQTRKNVTPGCRCVFCILIVHNFTRFRCAENRTLKDHFRCVMVCYCTRTPQKTRPDIAICNLRNLTRNLATHNLRNLACSIATRNLRNLTGNKATHNLRNLTPV